MRNQPKNREIKTKKTQIRPMRINPGSVQIKTTHTHDKSTQRTHRKIITHKTNHNPKLQKDLRRGRTRKKERKKEEEEDEAEEEKEDKEKRQRVERLTKAKQGREKRWRRQMRRESRDER